MEPITVNSDWPTDTGTWLMSASSFYESGGDIRSGWKATLSTGGVVDHWLSGSVFDAGTRLGNAWVQTQFPVPVDVRTFSFAAPSVDRAPATFSFSYSDDNLNFTTAQTYTSTAFGAWTTGVSKTFTCPPSGSHRWWRITVTKTVNDVWTGIHTLKFFTGFTANGLKLASVLPVSTSQFKIVMSDAIGAALTSSTIPISLPFYITLIKNGQIVNTGLYTISTAGAITTA